MTRNSTTTGLRATPAPSISAFIGEGALMAAMAGLVE